MHLTFTDFLLPPKSSVCQLYREEYQLKDLTKDRLGKVGNPVPADPGNPYLSEFTKFLRGYWKSLRIS